MAWPTKKWIFQNLRYDYHNPIGGNTHFDQVDSSLKKFWDHLAWLKDTLKKSKTPKGVFMTLSVAVIAENPTNQDRK